LVQTLIIKLHIWAVVWLVFWAGGICFGGITEFICCTVAAPKTLYVHVVSQSSNTASKWLDMIFIFSAVIVATCLLLFMVINLGSLLRYHAGFSASSPRPEIEKSIAVPLLLVGIGTIAFFLAFSNSILLPRAFLRFGEIQISPLEPLGLLVMVLGYAIFIWSVIARGRYATSWRMPKDHKLVDWGPYRYVRHPSYLGYFLMFMGFVLLWQNVLAIMPLVAIPAYALITRREEEMLVAKFGKQYVEYQKNVGRFVPKLPSSKSSRGASKPS
jgi:protein-S-isoprenylcysteine O-methyltransferase Ste14